MSTSCNHECKDRIAQLEAENEALKKELDKREEWNAFQIINQAIIDQSERIPVENQRPASEIIAETIDAIDASNNEEIIQTKNELLSEIDEFSIFLDATKEQMIEQSGGYNDSGRIKNSRNTEAVNHVMFELGKGNEIMSRLIGCIKMINEKAELSEQQAKELPLRIDLDFDRKGQTWDEYIFKDMPIGATIPIFSKFSNDCKASKVFVLNVLKERL